MARAYASIVLKAPVEAVWGLVRDFNALPKWAPAVASSKIEGGLDSDVVGCVRSLATRDGGPLSASGCCRSTMPTTASPIISRSRHFPVRNYIASVRLYPITHTDETFAEWESTFDEAAGDEGKYEAIISREVFAANWANLAKIIAAKKPKKPEGAVRWKGFQPNKVWTSRVIRAPVDKVWGVMRDFAGMGAWHEDITRMHMLGGVRCRQGIRHPRLLLRRRPFERGAAAPLRPQPILLLSHHQMRDSLDQLCLGRPALARHRQQHHLRRVDRRLGCQPAG